VSAFATVSGLETILSSLSPTVVRKEIHIRWRADDLLTGASDLGVYKAAHDKGFAVFMQPSLHAKFMLADRQRVILGSANFTGRGLGIGSESNIEVGTSVTIDRFELRSLQRILAQSTLVTPELYERIQAFVHANETPSAPVLEFSAELQILIDSQFNGLWVRDLPLTPYPPIENRPSGDQEDSDIELASTFNTSKCVKWLRTVLLSQGRQIYFGELTAALHGVLLEDPLPYRTEVKRLTLNLMNWCVRLCPNEFTVDAPNHSQRLFLR
jgi:hypothetical protein